MFKALFYSVFIYFIYKSLLYLSQPKLEQKKIRVLKKLTKKYANLEYDKWNVTYRKLSWEILPYYILLFLWLFIGLYTFNWLIFVMYIVFIILLSILNNVLLKMKITPIFLYWIDSFIFLVLSIFVIINSYHLKIDVSYLINF